jgi:hypothetical protein
LEDVLKLADRYQRENEAKRQQRMAHKASQGRKGR